MLFNQMGGKTPLQPQMQQQSQCPAVADVARINQQRQEQQQQPRGCQVLAETRYVQQREHQPCL